ncbi:MAG: hypothetical protein HYU31_01620 [Deltaproteobacteria bacterium]|nr:hypothetical protein [Deltaproteobacteria bacterium]MBI2365376.1 hypothetical protein [Deltaproteobacteria bacterium]MBI2532969.1 hypothetical protein [Deltaproteobacteria bacterium]
MTLGPGIIPGWQPAEQGREKASSGFAKKTGVSHGFHSTSFARCRSSSLGIRSPFEDKWERFRRFEDILLYRRAKIKRYSFLLKPRSSAAVKRLAHPAPAN